MTNDFLNNIDNPLMLSDNYLFRTLLKESNDDIYFKDKDSRFVLSSTGHANHFGYDHAEDIIGKSDADFFPEAIAAKTRAEEVRIMETGIPMLNSIEVTEIMSNGKPTGEIHWYSTSKYPLRNQNNEIIGIWGVSKNITEQKLAKSELADLNHKYETLNQKLIQISIIDELSGLYNRRHFYDILKKTMRIFSRVCGRGYDSGFSIILADIDEFKTINDTYGHVIGDAAIRHIAKLLQENTRASDDVFRYGGDEFAIILPDTNNAGAKLLAERLRNRIESTPFSHENVNLKITMSFGIASYNHQLDSTEIVQEADTHLYEAKEKGRNCIC